MQTELQSEFNVLIKEISKEVLELSVSKSIRDSSSLIKNQVPAMTKNIEELKLALRNLHEVNNDHKKRQEATTGRHQKINLALTNITSLLDDNLEKIQSDIVKQARTSKIEIKENTTKQTVKLEQRLTELKNLTKRGVITGLTTKKILIWTLLFSIGSFGIMITLLLHTLKIISF